MFDIIAFIWPRRPVFSIRRSELSIFLDLSAKERHRDANVQYAEFYDEKSK
jgi:hypothetical protein